MKTGVCSNRPARRLKIKTSLMGVSPGNWIMEMATSPSNRFAYVENGQIKRRCVSSLQEANDLSSSNWRCGDRKVFECIYNEVETLSQEFNGDSVAIILTQPYWRHWPRDNPSNPEISECDIEYSSFSVFTLAVHDEKDWFGLLNAASIPLFGRESIGMKLNEFISAEDAEKFIEIACVTSV